MISSFFESPSARGYNLTLKTSIITVTDEEKICVILLIGLDISNESYADNLLN